MAWQWQLGKLLYRCKVNYVNGKRWKSWKSLGHSIYKKKRVEVLKTVKPILEPFDITEVDYVIDEKTYQETLVIDDTKIGCTCNSIEAILQEVVGYLFIKT